MRVTGVDKEWQWQQHREGVSDCFGSRSKWIRKPVRPRMLSCGTMSVSDIKEAEDLEVAGSHLRCSPRAGLRSRLDKCQSLGGLIWAESGGLFLSESSSITAQLGRTIPSCLGAFFRSKRSPLRWKCLTGKVNMLSFYLWTLVWKNIFSLRPQGSSGRGDTGHLELDGTAREGKKTNWKKRGD